MNILFLSNLTTNLWAGPNNSVPAQVAAQSKIDNVLWFNNNTNDIRFWKNKGLPIVNLSDTHSATLEKLPVPFNNPDIIVVEETYCHPFNKIISTAQRNNIPYIIIPRSTLTNQAQKHKFLKKIIGNFLYFNRMFKKAAAIQYLTDQEYKESGDVWNKNSFILPNGINIPDIPAKSFESSKINAVYIGRLEKYQKGLDILLSAICKTREDLINSNFTLKLYGPDRENTVAGLKKFVNDNGLSDIVCFMSPVFGDEKADVLKQADIFIMSSRFEGHPMGLIEALAYGLPCIATTGTNMRVEIEKNNAGWTADNNEESIAAALKAMLAERKQLSIKSRNARNLASQYDWEQIAWKSHEIYSEIINSNRK